MSRDGSITVEALEQWEVDDPAELKAALVDRWTAQVEADAAEHVPDHPALVGGQEDHVTGGGPGRRQQVGHLGVGQELGHG